MRLPPLALAPALALALALAGCVTPPPDNGPPSGNATDDDNDMAMLPPPINDTKAVQGSADPLPVTGAVPACEAPTAQCFRYAFTLNLTANITADLTWGTPANDFDLYVYQDGASISGATGGSSPPGTAEHIEMELEAGEYELVVAAYAVGQDSFKVAATFS